LPQLTKTKRAEQDLDEIWLHIALDDPPAADKGIDDIGRTCGLLLAQPTMGRARPELAAELRSFPAARSYIVYYRLMPSGVELVRVLHGACDITNVADQGGLDG
jgi:toxin ParE1/3/4